MYVTCSLMYYFIEQSKEEILESWLMVILKGIPAALKALGTCMHIVLEFEK